MIAGLGCWWGSSCWSLARPGLQGNSIRTSGMWDRYGLKTRPYMEEERCREIVWDNIRISVVKFKEIPFSEQNCCLLSQVLTYVWIELWKGYLKALSLREGLPGFPTAQLVGNEQEEGWDHKDTEMLWGGHVRKAKSEAGQKCLRPKQGFLVAVRSRILWNRAFREFIWNTPDNLLDFCGVGNQTHALNMEIQHSTTELYL